MKRCPDHTRLAVFIFLLVFLVQNAIGAEEDLFDRSKLSGDWSGKPGGIYR